MAYGDVRSYGWIDVVSDGDDAASEEQKDYLKAFFNRAGEEIPEDEPIGGGWEYKDFLLEELYLDNNGLSSRPEIYLTGRIGSLFTAFSIPVFENDLQDFARELAEAVGIEPADYDSGLYIAPDEFSEVRERTCDGQGRINLGMDYAGTDVRVVVIPTSDGNTPGD